MMHNLHIAINLILKTSTSNITEKHTNICHVNYFHRFPKLYFHKIFHKIKSFLGLKKKKKNPLLLYIENYC